MATGYTARRPPGRTPGRTSSRLRTAIGLGALAEVVVLIAVASWIGVGWTVLATLATSALGWALLARQGTKALGELRQRAEEHRAPGRALGDAGLVALGGLLMVLPGAMRGPVRVRSVRSEPGDGPAEPFRAGPATRVIEGEIAPDH